MFAELINLLSADPEPTDNKNRDENIGFNLKRNDAYIKIQHTTSQQVCKKPSINNKAKQIGWSK